MTDRELLELAAKAGGLTVIGHRDIGVMIRSEACKSGFCWNPMIDDGDNARLESSMGFDVSWYDGGVLVGPRSKPGSAHFRYYSDHDGDKQAARRYAGVCAAAEIGKRTP